MSAQIIALVAVLTAVGVAVAWSWGTRRDSRRRERVFAFAITRGWTFEHEAPDLVDRWTGFPFGRGQHREATTAVRGHVGGRPFVAFEYTFLQEDEKDAVSLSGMGAHYSVVVVDLPTFLPQVVVEPRSVVQRALSTGVELESEDFNRAYRVSAPDPKVASDLLTPRTMAMLLSRPRIAFRVEGTHLISWVDGLMDPMDVLRRLSTLDAVIDGVPGFLWAEHGQRQPMRRPSPFLDPRHGSGPAPPRPA